MARTPRVKAVFTTPAGFDVDAFAGSITNRLAARQRHFDRVLPSPGGVVVDAAFVDDEEARQFFQWLRNRLGHTGGPTGRITWHLCSHAQGENATEPCDQAPEFTVIT